MEKIVSELQTIADYLNFSAQFEPIRGYLLPIEGFTLMKLAAKGGGAGAIVEIGSFMGRSTCWLATGSKSACREKVVAIDHFHGSPEHQPGAALPEAILATEGSTFSVFQENIRQANVEEHIIPICSSSEDAAKTWNGPIRLLFIDGDHSYEGVSRDLALWLPFVVKGGLICLHDVNNSPEVTRFYQELLQNEPALKPLFVVISLAVLRKCS